MVMYYSPEPQRDSDEPFNIENLDDSPDVIFMGIETPEGNDVSPGALDPNEFGYELLPQEVPVEQNDDVETDPVNLLDSASETVSRSNELTNNYGEVMTMTEECANKTRPNIEINAEEVRAAMRNVTLPPSSFPPWAASIPESQWTQFLFMRLANNDT